MLDTIERTTETELPLDTAAKRALIETELRKDAGRSDREIARIVGCDHKTVGSARERLGIASPLGNSAPSQTVTNRHGVTLSPELFPILNATARTGEKKFNPFDPDDDCLVAPERLGLEGRPLFESALRITGSMFPTKP
jgi:hypothetical protein